jgi:hypothetical protein
VDVYEIEFDLREGVRDLEFSHAVAGYLGRRHDAGVVESWRLLRRKLGLGAGGEFKILIETRDLAQLDAAFQTVSRRDEPVESAHRGVNALVTNFRASLYRDFPDAHRVVGDERF